MSPKVYPINTKKSYLFALFINIMSHSLTSVGNDFQLLSPNHNHITYQIP